MNNKSQPAYKRIGVLDIGSNSVRFVIYELFGAAFTAIYNEKVLAGLGRELRTTGSLSKLGKEKALEAINRFKIIADAQNIDRILIGATAAMRVADDAAAFISEVKQATGWDIHPISGKDEARLTAQGVIAAEPRADGIAADLGGASLEIIPIDHGQAKSGVSYPIGPFPMIGDDLSNQANFDVTRIKASITKRLEASDQDIEPGKTLYLVGGAWRNLAIVHQARHLYPLKTVQGYSLMPGAASDLARWAYGAGREDLLNWPGLAKLRAETLPYSGLLLDILLTRLSPSHIVFSSTGLREGLIYDSMPDKLKQRDALLDGCRDLARGNLQGRHFAGPLYKFLAPLDAVCSRVFDSENEARLRRAACQLVGIGKGLHPDYRASLVFEDVLYAPLSGLTHKERAYLALILFHSYTRSQKTPNNDALNLLLSLDERRTARIYGTAIRLGVVVSGRSPELLKDFELTFEDNKLGLAVSPMRQSLLTERVTIRLERLGRLLGLDTVANIVSR